MWQNILGEACATDGCSYRATARLEVGGVGSDYCSGCRAKIEARDDAQLFGVGFTREYPDGRVERIPPEQVVMFNRPNNQEA